MTLHSEKVNFYVHFQDLHVSKPTAEAEITNVDPMDIKKESRKLQRIARKLSVRS